MSEPIIIETTTTTRERLVLVPPGTCTDYEDKPGRVRLVTTDGRDATPDDLARGGWVRTPKCLCDAFCDEPCPVHARENALQDERNATIARAEKAERERDEAKELVHGLGVQRDTWEERCRTASRELVEARAELERLTAPGEPTDEELERIFFDGVSRSTNHIPLVEQRAAGLRAVAAHARQERCLVAQAVAANVDIRVCEDDGGGFMVGVHAPGCDEELARCVPAAEVPATLASLLGEVAAWVK